MKHHLPLWESLTNDPIILDAIKHHHIEFEAELPTQMARPNKIHFSPAEITIIDAEIAKLLSKEILTLVNHTPDSLISNIFIRPKTDGTHRMILNLKPLMNLLITIILKWIRSELPSSSSDLDALWHR